MCISLASLLILQLQGKMKLYVFLLFAILAVDDNIKFNPELQKNILKFGYGINYKYEGMLAHSFDRFYIIAKFVLPSMGDLKFSNLKFDHSCTYMNKKYTPNIESSKYLAELKTCCNKIKPFVSHYSKLIKSYNATVYNILTNEIRLLLPRISKQKHGIVSTLLSSFIGLAYEGISSFLQRKCEDTLQKTMTAMNNGVNFQCNKLLKLDNTMLMYGIYNAETLGRLINTVQEIHNVTSHKRLFAGEHNPALFRLLYMNALGIQQYAFDSLLSLRVVQDKYISLYKELITQLKSYVSAIRILTKGYLPTTLITLSKLQEILAEVIKSLQQTNPDYALVLGRLHLYYNMQLVTFGIDREMSPSHPYVLVNRSILCNCGTEADSHHLLESLAACDDKPTELTMHFTINLAFSNYLELIPNMTDQLSINRGKTHFEQTLPKEFI